jgi:hypothetical protein
VVEDWGKSELADKHKINGYPVVFIKDKVFAYPKDFGFAEGGGKYAPWYNLENQRKFKEDLRKYLEKVLKTTK